MALRQRHAQTVQDSSSSYETNYIVLVRDILTPNGHQNGIIGLKVMPLYRMGGFSLLVYLHREVSAHSLRSRLVSIQSGD